MYDRSRTISAPWVGWKNDLPAMLSPRNSFSKITGWLFNKGRIQSFPNVTVLPSPPDGNVIQGMSTFLDVLGFQHTVVVTKANVYFLTMSGTYTLLGSTQSNSFTDFSLEVFLNKVFFCNGNAGHLLYVDGSNFVGAAGNVPGTAFFTGKLAGSLIQLNLLESNQVFPLSVRWSAINNPLQWDITVDPTAGSAIIPEVEDQISGFSNQKGQGIIYRLQGITIMSPGSFPRFTFNSFEAGPTGVGVQYPYTLGNYGDESMFCALDDIYQFSLSEPKAVGGPAKRSIFNDLGNASSEPFATILGTLGQGVDYKAYWLSIPQQGDSLTSMWVYHYDDQTWINEQLPYGKLYNMSRIAIA